MNQETWVKNPSLVIFELCELGNSFQLSESHFVFIFVFTNELGMRTPV